MQLVTALPTVSNCRFTGKERDAESGLDYFGARYYGPSMGRFTSPDPWLGSLHLENPQSLNRYAYVLNHPLVKVDPTGLDCIYLSDDSKSVEEVQQGGCEAGDGGYWVPGTYNNRAVAQSDGTLTGFESTSGYNGFVSSFANNGSISVQTMSNWMLPMAGSNYTATGMTFADTSQEQGMLQFMYAGQSAGWIGTPQGVAGFYGASLLGASPAIAGSLAELPTFHVAYGAEGIGPVNALGDFFDMTVTRAKAAQTFANPYFTFNVPVLSTEGLAAEGQAAWSCATACFSAFARAWIP